MSARIPTYTIERDCEQCGERMVLVINPIHARRKHQRFCSRACANRSRSVIREAAPIRAVTQGPPTPAHRYSVSDIRVRFHVSPEAIRRLRRRGVVAPVIAKQALGGDIHWYTQRDVDVMIRETMQNTQRIKAMWTRRMRANDRRTPTSTVGAQQCARCEKPAHYVLPVTREGRCAQHKRSA